MGNNRGRRGRPPGTPNAQYVEITVIPETCAKCGSTELTQVPGSKRVERPISGTLPNGLEYCKVVWIRKECKCGQLVMVRMFVPGKKDKPVEPTKQPPAPGKAFVEIVTSPPQFVPPLAPPPMLPLAHQTGGPTIVAKK